MTVQAVGSLMVLGLVIARAVNILKQPRASRLLCWSRRWFANHGAQSAR